jgi:hypothetical protein
MLKRNSPSELKVCPTALNFWLIPYGSMSHAFAIFGNLNEGIKVHSERECWI